MHALIGWVVQFSTSPYGIAALGIISFAESSFFPIPPDVLLIPMALADQDMAFVYATIATVTSVLGGCFGYFIGKWGGRLILSKLVSPEKIAMVEHYYQKYDVWAVGLAAFTPIPYKVFTISAGAFNLDLKRFIIVSILGRGGRFYAVAAAIYIFGPTVKEILDKYFELTVLLFSVLLIGGFVGINHMSKRISKAQQHKKDHEIKRHKT